MDPNETLEQLRRAADGSASPDEVQELFHDLDEWLSGGGFLPDAWDSVL